MNYDSDDEYRKEWKGNIHMCGQGEIVFLWSAAGYDEI